MGKGDKKTKRGKIFMGTFGTRRPHNKPAGKASMNGQGSAAGAVKTPAGPKATDTAKKKT